MLRLEDLAELAERHADDLKSSVATFDIGGREFAFNQRPHLMGVVNLSPDSWYRESVCLTADAAVQRGQTLRAQGADLVDIGAESSVLDAARVCESAQQSMLLPVIRALAETGTLISAETYHPTVAETCLEAGANVLNITGPEQAGELYRLAAAHEAAVIICHVQGANVREVENLKLDDDPIPQLLEFFSQETDAAAKAGVTRMLIDPGLGFYYQNLADSTERIGYQMKVFLNSFRLRRLGWPVCHALPHAFEHFREEVRCAEHFFAVLAALGKTSLFRTHEVPRTRAVLETLGAWRS